jgi:CheY-like chemotaxis protein
MYVIDVAMPVKDGITATKEIRQFEREASLPRVRIAVLTCFSSAEYQKNAFAAGADLFLIKPVQMKALKPILEMDPEVVVPR